jgi:HAE1 family hydrophobic/amphiphilic exporter-1
MAVTYWPLALAVIFSLSASLFVSFTLTPLLCAMVPSVQMLNEASTRGRFSLTRWFLRIGHGYQQLVFWSLHHKMVLMAIVGFLGVMFVQIWREEISRGGFSFFSNRQDRVGVFVRLPQGSELSTADEVIKQFEQPLKQVSGYKDMTVNVNQNYAHLQVSFDQESLKTPFPLALKAKLVGIAQGFAGIGISVYGISNDDNYYAGTTGYETYNSSITLLGYNYKKLMDFSEDILKQVKRQRRVKTTDIQTSSSRFRGGSNETETVLVVNRDQLNQFPVSIQYLLGFIQRNLKVESTSFTKYQGEEVRLEVKFEDAEDFDVKDLEALTIPTADGQRLRLADFMTLETRKVSQGIDRKDQQFAIKVRWDYRGTLRRAKSFRDEVFAGLQLPPGFKAELEVNEDLTEEENQNLTFVILLACIVVFMIIAALYESLLDPLIIFLTIPLAFLGVSWIYWFTLQSFDSTAYIGLIILAGIVVNNSILLVSHLNLEVSRRHQTGLSYHQAVAKAAKDRFRPIVLTAVTTIVGLLPLLEDFVWWFQNLPGISSLMALMGGSDASKEANIGVDTTLSLFSSLSRTTVGGMLSATLSTLIIIPMIYVLFGRLKNWVQERKQELAAPTPTPQPVLNDPS